MPSVTASDIVLMKVGGGSLTGDAYYSLGAPLIGSLEELFPAVQPAQASSGYTDYACAVICNYASGTDGSFVGGRIYFSSQTSSPKTSIQVAVSGEANVTGGEFPFSVREAAPYELGLTFSSPSSIASAIELGNIDSGNFTLLYFKRIIEAGAMALNPDICTFVITNAVS